MGEDPRFVFVVGCPSPDVFSHPHPGLGQVENRVEDQLTRTVVRDISPPFSPHQGNFSLVQKGWRHQQIFPSPSPAESKNSRVLSNQENIRRRPSRPPPGDQSTLQLMNPGVRLAAQINESGSR